MKVKKEGRWGCVCVGGGFCVKRKKYRQSQKLSAAECAKSISAITFLSDYSLQRGRKKQSRERHEEGRGEQGGICG